MKKVIVLAGALMLIAAACTQSEPILPTPSSYNDGVVKLAGREISVDIAADSRSQAQGLSGRDSLEENQGMVFIFNVPEKLQFWMKDMKFAIDMIWINGDEVVDISADAQPEPGVSLVDLKVYSPALPANRVLEVKAGWAARNGLKIGDKIEIIQVIETGSH